MATRLIAYFFMPFIAQLYLTPCGLIYTLIFLVPLHDFAMSSHPSLETAEPAVDEVTPLLTAPNTAQPAQAKEEAPLAAQDAYHDDREDDTPLPKIQIFLLCYARLVEPIAFFGIFPFINKMIWETGNLKEEDVGFYTGLIVSWLFLSLYCEGSDGD